MKNNLALVLHTDGERHKATHVATRMMLAGKREAE